MKKFNVCIEYTAQYNGSFPATSEEEALDLARQLIGRDHLVISHGEGAIEVYLSSEGGKHVAEVKP